MENEFGEFYPSVLSQNEIDMLIKAINVGDAEPEETATFGNTQKKVRKYDFYCPDRFSKNEIRTISIIHEDFAREFMDSPQLLKWRNGFHFHVASVDQLTYEKFIRFIPCPTLLAIINCPQNGSAFIQIDNNINHAIINKLFGGKETELIKLQEGNNNKEWNELTILEQKVMTDFINQYIINLLGNAWERICLVNPMLEKIETNPHFCEEVPNYEMVVNIAFEIAIDDIEGMFNICIPYKTIHNKKNKIFLSDEIINQINIPVTVQLGKKSLPLKYIREAEVGTFIELDKLAVDFVDIFAGNVLIGHGEVVI